MMCARCRGFMVPERFEHTRVDSGERSFDAWRCVNCGAITDPIITAQRGVMAPAGRAIVRIRNAA